MARGRSRTRKRWHGRVAIGVTVVGVFAVGAARLASQELAEDIGEVEIDPGAQQQAVRALLESKRQELAASADAVTDALEAEPLVQTPPGVLNAGQLESRTWLRPARVASAEVRARVRGLADEHERMQANSSPVGADGRLIEIPNLPVDANAPARMDAGGGNAPSDALGVAEAPR